MGKDVELTDLVRDMLTEEQGWEQVEKTEMRFVLPPAARYP